MSDETKIPEDTNLDFTDCENGCPQTIGFHDAYYEDEPEWFQYCWCGAKRK